MDPGRRKPGFLFPVGMDGKGSEAPMSENRRQPASNPPPNRAGVTTSARYTEATALGARATKLIHGGILRSAFGETCEAIYMTSGFV